MKSEVLRVVSKQWLQKFPGKETLIEYCVNQTEFETNTQELPKSQITCTISSELPGWTFIQCNITLPPVLVMIPRA